ncbi:MAG: DNA polymerase-3 subunit delta' [Cryomorphaceae bacterium]|jgi:DNA polymerase-3 subunit delta'
MASFQPTIHPWNQELWQHLTLEPERSNHALLFNGDAGLGKKDLAMALAHFVMTETHSQSATLFSAGSHPDLHVIMPEAQIQENLVGSFARRYIEPHAGKKPRQTITIDQIRKLSAALVTHPHIAGTRVIVIYAAETMNRSAANALLKSLEEPPQNTLFLMVSDELSKLAKTIRSRCSLLNFKAPDFDSARAWLALQGILPEDEIDNHLAMANNHPLRALSLYESNYLQSLKSVFTDVNGLWTQRSEATQVARNWQSIGASVSVDILQKLSTDLLRASLSDNPKTVFFPVQRSWIMSISKKLSKERLLDVIDELVYAKKMLATTVDQQLVLETLSIKFRGLPV